MLLLEKSPHLAGVLKRLLCKDDLAALEIVFSAAVELGAESELDFVRKAESSYNSRPARIPLLLINEEKLSNLDILAAAMASCVQSHKRDDFRLERALPMRSREILQACALPIGALQGVDAAADRETKHEAAVLISALWLDRMRHLHLAEDPLVQSLRGTLCEETTAYIELARVHTKRLHLLLEAWQTRFRIIHPRLAQRS